MTKQKDNKNTWVLISITIGIFIAIGSYYCVVPNWKASVFLVFPIATILVILRNPELVFIRAFSIILLAFLALNKFFFTLDGKTENYNFQLGSNEIGTPINLMLLVLAALVLILHFLKVNGNLKGTVLEFKSNKVGDVKGNNIHINQS